MHGVKFLDNYFSFPIIYNEHNKSSFKHTKLSKNKKIPYSFILLFCKVKNGMFCALDRSGENVQRRAVSDGSTFFPMAPRL